MMQQYEDIISRVNVEFSEEDKNYINKYIKTNKGLGITVLVLLFLTLIMFVCFIVSRFIAVLNGTNRDLKPVFDIITFIACIATILFVTYRSRKGKEMQNITAEKCDAKKALSMYIMLAGKYKKNKYWDLYFYNIAVSLINEGRREDCRKIMELFPKYCPYNRGRVYYVILQILLAYQERNATLLGEHTKVLEQLQKNTKLPLSVQMTCKEVMYYQVMLSLENQGAYQELCILFQNSIPAKFMLGKVKQQYILYKVAEKLGMEEAKQHRDFVLKHGGTTFYKKELEALTSEELHNETDVK